MPSILPFSVELTTCDYTLPQRNSAIFVSSIVVSWFDNGLHTAGLVCVNIQFELGTALTIESI